MSKASRKRIIEQVEKEATIKNEKRNSKAIKQPSRKSIQKSITECEDIDIYDLMISRDYDQKQLFDQLEQKIVEFPHKVLEDLIVFYLKACGYAEITMNLTVGENMSVNTDNLLKKIYDLNVRKAMNDFPLLGKSKENKQLRNNYIAFWTSYTKNSESFAFESDVLTTLVDSLIAFSKSKLRTIRYGSVETILTISNAIVDMIPRLNDEFSKQKDILKSEKKTKSSKKVEEMEKSNDEVKDQIKKLEKTLNTIERDFIKKRHEDAMPEIRMKIVEYFAYGVNKLPDFFIDENLFGVLKYLLQNDQDPQVLLACLDLGDALAQPDHEDSEKAIDKGLRSLKGEFFELCFNSNSRVATKAFKFIKGCVSRFDFKDDELRELYHLVFYESDDVMNVAADFIAVMSFDDELLNEAPENEEFVFLKKQEISRNQLISLTKIFDRLNQNEISNERVERFIEAFYRRTQVLFDLQTIIGLILEAQANKKSTAKTISTEKEKEILIRFIFAVIKVSKNYLASRFITDKGLKSLAERVLVYASDVMKLRANEILTHSKLNSNLLESVLLVFEECDLKSFFTSENETQYTGFLETLRNIFDISRNSRVIGSVVKLFSTYCRNPEVGQKMKTAVEELAENSVATFLSLEKRFEEGQVNNNELQKNMSDSLLKLSKLSNYFTVQKVASDAFIAKLFKLIDFYINQDAVNDDVTSHCLSILFYTQLWRLRKVTLNDDTTEEQAHDYFDFREKVIERLSKILKTDSFPAVRRPRLQKVQETCFSLLVETLSFLCADRFAKVKGLFYRPTRTLLNTLYDYLVLVDTQTGSDALENSESKQLLQNLRKTQKVTVEDESESEEDREEKLQTQETPEKKSHSSAQKESNEKFLYCASLLMKLFLSSTSLLYSEFAVKSTIYLLKSDYPTIESLLRTLLTNFKNKEIVEGNELMNYWKFVDEVLLRLYNENDLKKACEFAKLAARIFHEKNENLPQDKKKTVGDKYLQYFINVILYALSSQGKYDFLSISNVLANKAYLPVDNYKRVLAFFEITLKQKEKESEASDDGKENQAPNKKSEEGFKTDYIDRFRQTLCKITGLKYKKPAKSAMKSTKKNTRKAHEESEEADRSQSEERDSEPPLVENQTGASEEVITTKQPRKVKVLKKDKILKKEKKDTKKRKAREYSGKQDSDLDKKDAEEMVNGKKKKKNIKK